MPILYVNPARAKRKSKVRIGKLRRRSKARRNPSKAKKRRGLKLRSKVMAKKHKKKKSSKRGRRTAAKLGWARRRRKAKAHAPKRSRRRSRKAKRGRKSYARAAKLGRRRAKRRHKRSRARASYMAAHNIMGPAYRASAAGVGPRKSASLRLNPAKKRKRKRKYSAKRIRRRGRRTAAKLGHRRRRARARKSRRRYRRVGKLRGRVVYARTYTRNPGRMLVDLAKKAAPIVLATIGAKALASKIGPRIPMIDTLGRFQGPAVSILAIIGANFATKKVSALAKHRDAILMGFTISAIHETISALAPASVKGLLGMGDTYTQALADYVATSDYEQVVGMSDYVATGDMEQELGLDQELGYSQEMGDEYGQGSLGGTKGAVAPVPGQKFLAPVPGHSFTGTVPAMTDAYDNPDMLYSGIFRGGA